MNVIAKILGSIIRAFRTPLKLWTATQKLTALITGLALILTGLVSTTIILESKQEETTPTTEPTQQTETKPVETTLPPETTEPTTLPAETTEATTVPEEILPVINDKVLELQELYAKNPHTAGWITVPDTKVDEVVMFSPDAPDKYLYADFNGKFNAGGTAYIDEVCDINPETKVLQIFGHHMLNGSHFTGLFAYEKESFWKEHRYVYYTTPQEARCYEVVAVVKDKDLPESAPGTKYYEFVAPNGQEQFDMYIDYFKEKSLYDTGVEVDYDDSFVMLVTCAYHTENGRFIVLAKRVP